MHAPVERTIKKLEKYKDLKIPVLSIYLGIDDKKSPNIKTLVSQLHSLVKKNLNKKEKEIFKKDFEKIESYLRESFNPRGDRSIAFFTSGERLFEALNFEFYLTPLCTISNSLQLKPIINAIKKHKKYLVLLADREKARLFTVHLGNIEEHEDIFGEYVPQQVKRINRAWKREDKILRHIEDHLHRHLKLIADSVSDFSKNKNIDFMIIGGHEELISKIKKHLPQNLAKKISGTFITELNIPINNVFLKSKKIAEKIEKK